MSENEIDELRRRFAREAMALMERKGEEVSRTRRRMAQARSSRLRLLKPGPPLAANTTHSSAKQLKAGREWRNFD